MLDHLRLLLLAMNFRADANETAIFARQLEFIKTATFDVRYPALKARLFIPVDTSVPSGAESFVWRAWDWRGMARILANYADDLPKVDVLAGEQTQGCKSIGNAYAYTLQDLRAASMAGVQLETKRANAARRAIENTIDELAAFGNTAAGLPGFLNNTNVPIMSKSAATAGAGVTLNGDWEDPATTPQHILDDLNAIANSVVVTTKEAHTPDTMLLPTSRYSILASRVWSVNDSRTILQVFLQNSPYIKNVDQWNRLDTADAAGTGPRAVCYERSPDVVGLVIPQDFEQLPPQAKGLAFEVPCHARVGGVVFYYPMAAVYADDI